LSERFSLGIDATGCHAAAAERAGEQEIESM
jgi:hypothetical protein